MVLPDRVPVPQTLGVVPHPVGVDDAAADGRGGLQHPAVHVGRYAGHHPLRWRAEPRGPRLAHQLVVTTDAARGHQHGLRGELDVRDLDPGRRLAAHHGRGLEDLAADTGDGTVVSDDRVDPAPEPEADPSGRDVLADPTLERCHHPGSGPPRHVEARDRVAVPVGAAVAALGPLAWPMVFRPVELRRAEPVLQGEVQRGRLPRRWRRCP